MDLSIIILNYNSADYLKKCLESITKSDIDNYKYEVIIVDNCSTDDSIKLAKTVKSSDFKFLELKNNKGFAHGNNQGLKEINPKTRFVLFLNPDTIVQKNTFKNMIEFFDQNKNVDAATCQIDLALNGKMQPECHRGFPTPWNSLCHFSGLSKVFPNSKIFSGYFMGNLDKSIPHKIDACVGAFLMVKKAVGDKIKWWNEKYFFYGEDLDFCYKLKQNNFNLYFNPNCKITHFQGVSSGLISKSKHLSKASQETKIKVAKASTDAMRIFYQENLFSSYSAPVRFLVMTGIKMLEIQRVFKAKYL
ncbi:MAG: glycosyltransferase family 2 protein [Candidatus Shapirobacteria bacterium]|nr:glycosyltransferase family 2 protein [Candidatus Shapirobacteria bacterium]MDD4410484.1 glycosyltransferase family 2 protein [Candidatus Shapirobacteria bacterium]